jgi:hypothetical protein
MPDREQPKPAPKPAVERVDRVAEIIALPQPNELSGGDAIRLVRALASNTGNIVVIGYGRRKAQQRRITRRQIELCVQRGTVTEGPFLNRYGNWQMNLYRHAAGEQLTCVVAIEWAARVLVISTF